MKSFTLEEWLILGENDPNLGLKMRLQTAENAEELRICVEEAVIMAIDEITQYRQFKQNKTEDELTTEIVQGLSHLGIPARHGAEYGGRTDVSVNMKFRFLWIAEAKLWKGSGWAFKGLRQLLTRYSTGTPGRDHGGIILFFQDKLAAPLMKKWSKSLADRKNITNSIDPIDSISFRSTHTHPSVGEDYVVRHFAVPLLWQPDDH